MTVKSAVKVETRKLIPGKVELLVPSFSPDGSMISYVQLTDPDAMNERRDLGCLTVVSSDGGEEILDIRGDLVALNYRERGRGYIDLLPVWSPDSRYLYFHFDDPQWESIGPRWSLFRADLRTKEVFQLPFSIDQYRVNTVEVSPSGEFLALHTRQRWKDYTERFFWKKKVRKILADQLVVSGYSGDHPVNIIDWPEDRLHHQEELGDFHWSPSEDLLGVIVRFKEGRGREECFLYLYDPKSKNRREIFRTREHLDHFAWSPDGKSIFFHTKDPQIQTPSKRYSVHRVDVDSGQVERLTEHQEFFYPIAPREGSTILLETHLDGGGRGISLLDQKTGDIVTVVKSGFNLYPSWAPSGEAFVYLRTKPDGKPFWTWPTEPTLQMVGGGSPIRLAPVDASSRLMSCKPSFSPDSREVLFVAQDESEEANARFPGIWRSTIQETEAE